ncbi:protein RICE SALT SENSITIVE 3 [Senna tora]|uniref:Protein RICE SALT SENSITIVE 3 n=1 Tax=Senna tora TaxID=362788 RepID=A0A835CLU4_9FABA|nr:protein RICE SALT SENSITIVE 3 [Senna tora]
MKFGKRLKQQIQETLPGWEDKLLVWEDGFCNFGGSSSGDYGKCELQPQLFFKMLYEIYNYGEEYIDVSSFN